MYSVRSKRSGRSFSFGMFRFSLNNPWLGLWFTSAKKEFWAHANGIGEALPYSYPCPQQTNELSLCYALIPRAVQHEGLALRNAWNRDFMEHTPFPSQFENLHSLLFQSWLQWRKLLLSWLARFLSLLELFWISGRFSAISRHFCWTKVRHLVFISSYAELVMVGINKYLCPALLNHECF